MPEIKILPIIKNIAIALIFFALGRLMVINLGTLGIVLIFIFVIGFYAIWWARFQRNKTK